MTPHEVERAYNGDLFKIPTRTPGVFFLVVKAIAGRRGGYRQATSRRIKAGRTPEWVPMFLLVTSVTFAKRFDLDSLARAWANRIPDLIDRATPSR